MTTTLAPTFDPLAEAIAAAEGVPGLAEAELPAIPGDTPAKTKDLLIIDYSGDLEKVWAA